MYGKSQMQESHSEQKDLQRPLNCDSQRPPHADKERRGLFTQQGTQVSTIWGRTDNETQLKNRRENKDYQNKTGSGKNNGQCHVCMIFVSKFFWKASHKSCPDTWYWPSATQCFSSEFQAEVRFASRDSIQLSPCRGCLLEKDYSVRGKRNGEKKQILLRKCSISENYFEGKKNSR